MNLNAGNTATITFDKTSIKLMGGPIQQLPDFDVPRLPDFLQPPNNSQDAMFTNVFIDEEVCPRYTYSSFVYL